MYFICECNQGFAASMVPFGAFGLKSNSRYGSKNKRNIHRNNFQTIIFTNVFINGGRRNVHILLTLNAAASSSSILKCFSSKIYMLFHNSSKTEPFANDTYPFLLKCEDAFVFVRLKSPLIRNRFKVTIAEPTSFVSHISDVKTYILIRP